MPNLDGYTVLANSDISRLKRKDQEKLKLLIKKVAEQRHYSGLTDLECLVVESNEPAYDVVTSLRNNR